MNILSINAQNDQYLHILNNIAYMNPYLTSCPLLHTHRCRSIELLVTLLDAAVQRGPGKAKEAGGDGGSDSLRESSVDVHDDRSIPGKGRCVGFW